MEPRQVALRVVVFQEEERVCAQCLEYDIAAQGQTLDDCLYQLGRLIVGHLAISTEKGFEPFLGLKRAPQQFWDWFERSRIPLTSTPLLFAADDLARKGVVVEPSQIRVAQPQAA